jgi:hypothetical protein
MLLCYVNCEVQPRKIYDAVEIGRVAKFKKSFPANVLTCRFTQSLRKQS